MYASMYGNTENAASVLASKLVEKGMNNVVMYDVSKTHISQLISETFKYSNVVLASVTYNLGIYPLMHNYLMDMKALNVQNRTFAILENGSWACEYSNVVLASVTYNLGIYPLMHNYLMDMKALNVQNRTFAILENGSWACESGRLMREFLENMRNMTVLDEKVTLTSSMTTEQINEMDTLVDSILNSMK